MLSRQLTPVVQQTSTVSTGWAYWLIANAGSSAVGAATSAATDTFLRTLINPAITGTAIIVGYASSLLFSVGFDITYWGASTVATGVSSLWRRATPPAQDQTNREGNLGFY